MGTINYKTSDYITIAYDTRNIDYSDDFYSDDIQYCFDALAGKLTNEHFYYFHVSLEPGYYEGFSIDIEFNFSYCFDSYEDKRAAQKEITRLKAFLMNCVNYYDCCAVSPGWCTGFSDYNATLAKINAAVKEMRQTVKDTPTWATLPTGEKYA